MESKKYKPIFSVIVIAFNRREFIKSAIDSVLNQTLDKTLFEIIVIKNFKDQEIDDYINLKKITNIISEDISLGGKLIQATESTQGKFISILEDDDFFNIQKLEFLNKYVSEDVCYIHNGFERRYVDKTESQREESPYFLSGGEPLICQNKTLKCASNMSSANAFFNCSSITISRDLLLKYKEIIKKITFQLDAFLFMIAFSDRRKLIHLPHKLTSFREHDYSIDDNDTYEHFKLKKMGRTLKILEEKRMIVDSFNSRIPRYMLYGDILYLKSTLKIFNVDAGKTSFQEKIFSLFPRPPYTTHFFKLKIIFIGFCPAKIRERAGLRIYKNALRKRNLLKNGQI